MIDRTVPPPTSTSSPNSVQDAYLAEASISQGGAQNVDQSTSLPPQVFGNANAGFFDRRQGTGVTPAGERRQFASSYSDLSAEARELGQAVDQYKLLNRRRYVNYEELLAIIQSIGYSR